MHTLFSRVKLITMNFPVVIIIDGIVTCSGGRTQGRIQGGPPYIAADYIKYITYNKV
jgi:hypothetical protein